MASAEAFKEFLNAHEIGLVQGTSAWVNGRHKSVGVSEVAALTGRSPVENSSSLLAKKIGSRSNFVGNIACTWGSIFKPLARDFFEKKYSATSFGYKSSLNLPPGDPMHGKLTVSPDGFFYDHKQEEVKLVEFKCPCTRKIVRRTVPAKYADQLQTGLLISNLQKAVFVDCCF